MSYQLPAFATRVVRCLIPIVCPSDASTHVTDDEVLAEFARSFGALPPPVRAALLTGIAGYDALAAAIPRNRLRPAHRLDDARGRRYFASWWGSPNPLQREFVAALKGFVCMAYYELPAVKAGIGYTPDVWIDKVKRRRLNVHKPAIEAHEVALRTPDPLPMGHFEVSA